MHVTGKGQIFEALFGWLVEDEHYELPSSNKCTALQTAGRYIRDAGDKVVEAEVLLPFCTNFQAMGMDWKRSTFLSQIYYNQLKKVWNRL